MRVQVTIQRKPNEGLGIKIHSMQQPSGDAIGARVSEVIAGQSARMGMHVCLLTWACMRVCPNEHACVLVKG
jgi:hypothetical protein